MRERITFIHGSQDSFDPKQLHVRNDTLHIDSLNAAREDRLSASLYELPQELWRVLKQCHELHIRWVAERSYDATAPFVSILAPGLHVFYTPLKDHSADSLCPLLEKVFGGCVECESAEDSFIHLKVLSQRFASTSALQYHQLLPSLNDLVAYVREKVCASDDKSCKSRSKSLKSANYVDVDYDAISQSLTFSAFWDAGPASVSRTEQIDNGSGSKKVEVGVIAQENSKNPEELSFGGYLTVLGEDKKPKPTLFSFPARHHPGHHGSIYSAKFKEPTGLHPTFSIIFAPYMRPPNPECALHTYITLPSSLFVDKYQLSSPNFLASNNLQAIRALAGETDLEAPEWAVSKWGSAVLLELAPPRDTHKVWTADLSLHLRYLPLSNSSGHQDVSVAWPVVFWACPSDEGTKMNTSPFDRVNLGYDGLFGPRTRFYHLQPETQGKLLVENIKVPVLNTGGASYVNNATIGVVMLGFVWVCWQILQIARKDLHKQGRKKNGKTD